MHNKKYDDVSFLDDLIPVELGSAFAAPRVIGSLRNGLTGREKAGSSNDPGGSSDYVFKK